MKNIYLLVYSNNKGQEAGTTWDDTKLVEGDPEKYVTIARKSGDDWYVGAICGGGTSRTASIILLNNTDMVY
jgi:hypothetical protein